MQKYTYTEDRAKLTLYFPAALSGVVRDLKAHSLRGVCARASLVKGVNKAELLAFAAAYLHRSDQDLKNVCPAAAACLDKKRSDPFPLLVVGGQTTDGVCRYAATVFPQLKRYGDNIVCVAGQVGQCQSSEAALQLLDTKLLPLVTLAVPTAPSQVPRESRNRTQLPPNALALLLGHHTALLCSLRFFPSENQLTTGLRIVLATLWPDLYAVPASPIFEPFTDLPDCPKPQRDACADKATQELLRKGNEPYRKAVMAKITAALEQDVRASTPQRRILDFGVAALIRANVGNLPRCLNCFAEKTAKQMCNSHIISKHYLNLMDVAAMIDPRGLRYRLITATESMTVKLLCRSCDNKQGELEKKIKGEGDQEGERYRALAHLSSHGTLPNQEDLVYVHTHDALYSFFVPNLFRFILYQMLNHTTPHWECIWTAFDRLRSVLALLLAKIDEERQVKQNRKRRDRRMAKRSAAAPAAVKDADAEAEAEQEEAEQEEKPAQDWPVLVLYAIPIGTDTWNTVVMMAREVGSLPDPDLLFFGAVDSLVPDPTAPVLVYIAPFLLCCSQVLLPSLEAYRVKPPHECRAGEEIRLHLRLPEEARKLVLHAYASLPPQGIEVPDDLPDRTRGELEAAKAKRPQALSHPLKMFARVCQWLDQPEGRELLARHELPPSHHRAASALIQVMKTEAASLDDQVALPVLDAHLMNQIAASYPSEPHVWRLVVREMCELYTNARSK